MLLELVKDDLEPIEYVNAAYAQHSRPIVRLRRRIPVNIITVLCLLCVACGVRHSKRLRNDCE